MIAMDENALICDFAETYHVFNYRELRPKLAAILAVGLRDDSRIKMKMAGLKLTPTQVLLAGVIDRLSILIWMQTKDGQTGRNRPKSIMDDIDKAADETKAFTSIEEYEAARKKLIGG